MKFVCWEFSLICGGFVKGYCYKFREVMEDISRAIVVPFLLVVMEEIASVIDLPLMLGNIIYNELVGWFFGDTIKSHIEANSVLNSPTTTDISVPMWGLTSICGRREKMEVAVVALPSFFRISDTAAHFFGVYDGHGGSEVANSCRDRLHLVLAEEFEIANDVIYLKPHIIPDPEMMFVSRRKEDECLIVARNGIWDILTNEEVCDVARRRILMWHKNGATLSAKAEVGFRVDPAAQYAAYHLSSCFPKGKR